MKYLIDTHVLLWASNAEKQRNLSPNAVNVLTNTQNRLFISQASFWEIAIKYSLGKLSDLEGGSRNVFLYAQSNGIKTIHITQDYLDTLENLPFIHRDPFDRIIIATAKSENMTIITSDENIRKYDVPFVW